MRWARSAQSPRPRTRCDVILARRALDAAQREVAACERALSRFDADSDLSRLNSAAGAWVAVDTRLIDALCRRASRAQGHARAVRPDDPSGARPPPATTAPSSCSTDRAGHAARRLACGRAHRRRPGRGRARVERGAAVDLGGIGKGFAATRALDAMRTAWPALTGALVDLGGDIAVWGTPPEGGLWRVDIADPRSPGRRGRNARARRAAASPRQDATRGASAPAGGSTTSSILRLARPPSPARSRSRSWPPSATEAEAHATALAIARSTRRATTSPLVPTSQRCSSLIRASPS